jgi:HK97 family phage major capsid protein
MTLEQLIEAAKKAIQDGDLELADKLTKQAKALKAVNDLQPAAPVESEEVKTLRKEVEDLKKFKAQIEAEPASNKAGHVVITEDEADKKAKQPWATLGEQLKAVYIAATQPHRTDDRLKAQKAVLGASEGVPSDGGFLVQPNFAAEIFKIAHDGGQILQRTRQIPIGANSNGLTVNTVDETSRATGSRWGGVQAYWAAEGEAGTATKPKFRQMELKLTKLIALFYSTDELLADTTALGAIAQQAVAEEMIWTAENAIIRGTGAGQPSGILNAGCLVTINKETGQAAATLVVQNFFKMYARLWGRSRANAVWYYNQDIEPQLLGLEFPVGTGGVPAYLPAGGLSASPYGTLLGRPMIPIEYASTLGTVGDIILADFSQYLTIDKGGVQAAESMHVQFLTDQMTFRWTYRIDGQPAWRSAMTPANGTATQSPFVVLQTRS